MENEIGSVHKLWITSSLLAADIFFKLLNRTDILGREHIPAGPGLLFVSNHVSHLDPVLIPYSLLSKRAPDRVWVPAKEELFQVPILGRMIASYGGFPVRRNGRDLAGIRKILRRIRDGKMMIFPEGTRSSDGRLLAGNRMVGSLIYQARPIVIPTAIVGTERVLPKGKKVPRLFSRIQVVFGLPLDLEDYYRRESSKETARLIIERVMEAIAELLETARSQKICPL